MVSFYLEYTLYLVLFVLQCLLDRGADPTHRQNEEKAYLLLENPTRGYESDDETDKRTDFKLASEIMLISLRNIFS